MCVDYWVDLKTTYVYGLLGRPQDDLCVWTIGPTSRQPSVWTIRPTSRRPMRMDYWANLKTTYVYVCTRPTSNQARCADVLCLPGTDLIARTYCVRLGDLYKIKQLLSTKEKKI